MPFNNLKSFVLVKLKTSFIYGTTADNHVRQVTYLNYYLCICCRVLYSGSFELHLLQVACSPIKCKQYNYKKD